MKENDEARPRVMIVEDDHAIRRLYSFLLAKHGYEVVEAEDGQIALERFRAQPCDLIVVDMNMPRVSGFDLVRLLREEHKSDVYIILITAYGTPDIERQAMALGVNEYVAKPFDFEELEGRVRAYFEEQGIEIP